MMMMMMPGGEALSRSLALSLSCARISGHFSLSCAVGYCPRARAEESTEDPRERRLFTPDTRGN